VCVCVCVCVFCSGLHLLLLLLLLLLLFTAVEFSVGGSSPYTSKGKVHPCTCTENLHAVIYRPYGPLGLEGGGGSASRPGRSLPPVRPGTHCTGDWVGPRAGLDRSGKSRPSTRIRSPDRPARSQSLYRLRYPAHLH
jgi:hypothetical protein